MQFVTYPFRGRRDIILIVGMINYGKKLKYFIQTFQMYP